MSSEHPRTSTFTPALLGLVWSAMFGFSAFFFSYSTMVTISGLGGLSTVTGGSVLTTMMLGVIIAQPFAPAVGRTLGLRGALLAAIGLQLIGQLIGLIPLPTLLQLVLAGLSGGIGFGFFVVLANAAVPTTTPAGKIGKALGFFGGITSLAAAVGAPLGLLLVESVPLWVFRLVVCVCLFMAVPTVVRFLPGRSAPEQNPTPAEAVDRTRDTSAEAGDRTGDTPAEAGPGDDSGPEVRATGSVPDAPGPPFDVVGPISGAVGPTRFMRALRLIIMLLPFLVGMITFGIIVGFGPGENVVGAALFILTMQLSAVLSRFVAGAVVDTLPALPVNLGGAVLTIIGLVLAATSHGWPLAAAMVIIGFGLGTLQSASLVMAFTTASSPGQASVAWNMSFDIGLAIAGVLGGVGFTYLGDSATFCVAAGLVLLTGLISLMSRNGRPNRAK